MNLFSCVMLCLLALREDQLFSGCEIRVDDTSQMSKQEKNRLPCHYLPRPAFAQQRIIPQSTEHHQCTCTNLWHPLSMLTSGGRPDTFDYTGINVTAQGLGGQIEQLWSDSIERNNTLVNVALLDAPIVCQPLSNLNPQIQMQCITERTPKH